MNKTEDKMQTISQEDTDSLMLTGKSLRNATKAELLQEAVRWNSIAKDAAVNANRSMEELDELKNELADLNKNQRTPGYTEVPVEELNDVISDVRYIKENLRKVLLNRENENKSDDLVMDSILAVERIHSFCLGRANTCTEETRDF